MRSRLPAAAAVLAVVVLALLGTVTAGPWEMREQAPTLGTPTPAPDQTPSVEPTTAPPPPAESNGGLSIVRPALIALAALALLALARMLMRLPRRRRRPPDAPEPPDSQVVVDAEAEPPAPDLPVLRRGVAAAEHALVRYPDPHDAVIAAWLAVEEAAADAGAPRRPAQTPTELATEVLGATRADPAAVRTLLGLYHRARFATGPSGRMGPTELATAARCLRTLAESWQVRT